MNIFAAAIENSFVASLLEIKATPGKAPKAADLRAMLESFDWQGWREEAGPVIRDEFQSVLVDSARRRSREVGITFDETDPFLQRRLTSYVGTRIVELEDVTKERISNLIRDAFANGEGMTLPDLATEIGESVREQMEGYADWRADRIARTETAIAYNTGDLLAWMQMGVTEVDVQDGTENDEACRAANGQRWPIEYALDHPIEHPNCERGFTPVLESIQQAGMRMLVHAWMERKAAELDAELKDFDESQPRDDHGRWTAGSEGETQQITNGLISDAQGQPVTVFHGSIDRKLKVPDPAHAQENEGVVFFTNHEDVAYGYTSPREFGESVGKSSGNVIKAHLKMSNPMVVDMGGAVGDQRVLKQHIDAAKAAGHDGVIFHHIRDSVSGERMGSTFVETSYAVFSKDQIVPIKKKREKKDMNIFVEALEEKAGPDDEPRDEHGQWTGTGSALHDKIQKHLAEHPSHVVRIQTMTRATDFKPKHAGMFRPAKAPETGVYFQSGKKWSYALPSSVFFGKPKKG